MQSRHIRRFNVTFLLLLWMVSGSINIYNVKATPPTYHSFGKKVVPNSLKTEFPPLYCLVNDSIGIYTERIQASYFGNNLDLSIRSMNKKVMKKFRHLFYYYQKATRAPSQYEVLYFFQQV